MDFDKDEVELRFKECCEFLLEKGETLRLSDEEKLNFYALYKQATEGKCTTPAPSFWDFRGLFINIDQGAITFFSKP
jgi:acyl-CoA-binding protein